MCVHMCVHNCCVWFFRFFCLCCCFFLLPHSLFFVLLYLCLLLVIIHGKTFNKCKRCPLFPVRLHNGLPCRECKRGDPRYCYGGASQTTSRGGSLAQTYTSRKEELKQLEDAVKEQERRDYEATLASGLFVKKGATWKERFLGWFGLGTSAVPQPPARVIRPEVGVEPQGNAAAFGTGSFGYPADGAMSGISQSAAKLQPTEFSVWRMMEALDGKPLAAAVFGASKCGKTLTTGALLHSLQDVIGFENLLYGLGDSSSYDSPDNETLRRFVHEDQVTRISCPADIGNLIDRAVSTDEKKVLVLDDIMQFLGGGCHQKNWNPVLNGQEIANQFCGLVSCKNWWAAEGSGAQRLDCDCYLRSYG